MRASAPVPAPRAMASPPPAAKAPPPKSPPPAAQPPPHPPAAPSMPAGPTASPPTRDMLAQLREEAARIDAELALEQQRCALLAGSAPPFATRDL